MTWYFLILFAGIGACLGSFVNAWVYRVRHQLPLLFARSHCPQCGYSISWWQNIPMVSFVALRGACYHCKQRIPIQYPLVEFAGTVLMGMVAWALVVPALPDLNAVPWIWVVQRTILVLGGLFLFVYDAKYQELPDMVTLPMIALLCCIHALAPVSSFAMHLLVGGVGAGFFLLQYVISKGKWIGGGDIRLGAIIGLALGRLPLLLLAYGVAYVVGALWAVSLLALRKKKMASEIAFGTFLLIGLVVAMTIGEPIVDWYVGVVGW
jgi:prepilin signal peptidase PulO-like enzyme (type II secretory pathway)